MKINKYIIALFLMNLTFCPLFATNEYDSSLSWRTIETQHFFIHFPRGISEHGKWAAAFAETIYKSLKEDLKFEPTEKTHLRLLRQMDIANGFALNIPFNAVTITISQPDGGNELSVYRNWLELVITHELVHIFSLDIRRGYYDFINRIFGKHPMNDPLSIFLLGSPNGLLPTWLLEGIAVYEETKLTTHGRLNSSDYEMVYRVAVEYDRLPSISDLHPLSGQWPLGNSTYIWGSRFVLFLVEKYGQNIISELLQQFSSRLPYTFNFYNESLLGKDDFAANFGQMIEQVKVNQTREIEQIKGHAGLTAVGKLTHNRGSRKTGTVFSSANEPIYVKSGVDIKPQITLLNSRGKEQVLVQLDNDIGASHLAVAGNYLYYTEGRLIDNELASEIKRLNLTNLKTNSVLPDFHSRFPTVSPDGRFIAFVDLEGGRQAIKLYQQGNKKAITLTHQPNIFDNYGNLGFSSDGKNLVFSLRKKNQRFAQLYSVEIASGTSRQLFQLEGDCLHPSYSNDNRVVLFSSNLTGVYNLFAFDIVQNMVYQITNLIEGAFYPAVDRSNQWIYFSVYGPDGYNLAKLKYQPFRWMIPLSMKIQKKFEQLDLRNLKQIADLRLVDGKATTIQSSVGYQGWRYLKPRGWLLDYYYFDELKRYYTGFSLIGEDPLERHAYAVAFSPVKIGVTQSPFSHPIYDLSFINSRSWGEVTLSVDGQPVSFPDFLNEGSGDFEASVPDDHPFDYWAYVQKASVFFNKTRKRNRYQLQFSAGIVYQSLVPDETILKKTNGTSHADYVFRGNVYALDLDVAYDSTVYQNTATSVLPSGGIRVESLIRNQYTSLEKAIPAVGKQTSKPVQMLTVSLEKYFSFSQSVLNGFFSLKFGSLFNYSPIWIERRIFGEYLSVGGSDGEFRIRGHNYSALRGLSALTGSVQVSQLLKAFYHNFGTWFLFNRDLVASTVLDFGTAWDKSFNYREVLSSVGVEMKYSLLALKFFPFNLGLNFTRSLNKNEYSVFFILSNKYRNLIY